jgi:hypothetical protein
MLVLTNIKEGAKIVSGISQTGKFERLKAQYIEAQRTGDKMAMNMAKAEAMKIMNEVGEAKDTVGISEDAFTQYHSTK